MKKINSIPRKYFTSYSWEILAESAAQWAVDQTAFNFLVYLKQKSQWNTLEQMQHPHQLSSELKSKDKTRRVLVLGVPYEGEWRRSS